jgi:hypothetical protein
MQSIYLLIKTEKSKLIYIYFEYFVFFYNFFYQNMKNLLLDFLYLNFKYNKFRILDKFILINLKQFDNAESLKDYLSRYIEDYTEIMKKRQKEVPYALEFRAYHITLDILLLDFNILSLRTAYYLLRYIYNTKYFIIKII